MKLIKCILYPAILLFTAGVLNLNAQNISTRFCMPRHLYLLADTVNNIFTQPMLSHWNNSCSVVRFTTTAHKNRYTPWQLSVSPTTNDKSLQIDLISLSDFDTLQTATVDLRVSNKRQNLSPVTIQIIGDSYVHGSFFNEALLKRRYVNNLKMVGLRRIAHTNQFDEGRGGWTVQKYFEVSTDAHTSYNGFMQPQADYRYWGSTEFWLTVFNIKNGVENNFDTRYSCGRFEHHLSRFNPDNGYLLKPQKHDVMYDNALKQFVVFNGKTWSTAKDGELKWNFNYSKYLKMWNIPTSDFTFVLLGLNEYRDSLYADYTLWNKRIEEMARQYHSINQHGKFVILTPCSSCGSMNNWRGDFTLRQNACMWKVRDNILRTFDNRENEGIYVVDVAIRVDGENGYKRNSDGAQTGNPHPYLSYPDMSIPVAAFILYHQK